jgi:hypothetical protein
MMVYEENYIPRFLPGYLNRYVINKCCMAGVLIGRQRICQGKCKCENGIHKSNTELRLKG